MDDGTGVRTVIGEHVVGDRRIWLELVGEGILGTSSGGFIDVGAVRVEPKLVQLSQARASAEWGRCIVCVESEDWVGQGGG